jgi:hypothetical protein
VFVEEGALEGSAQIVVGARARAARLARRGADSGGLPRTDGGSSVSGEGPDKGRPAVGGHLRRERLASSPHRDRVGRFCDMAMFAAPTRGRVCAANPWAGRARHRRGTGPNGHALALDQKPPLCAIAVSRSMAQFMRMSEQ